MKKLLFAVAIASAGLTSSLFSGQAQAGPTCTGTILNLGTGIGLSATLAQLSGGNCVIAGDKEFGSASVSGAISGTGNASFTALTLQGDVTVGFNGSVAGAVGTTGTINYSAMVVPGLAGGFLIHDLQKDFTLNGPAGAAARLDGTVTSSVGGFGTVLLTCSRTIGGASTCPVENVFGMLVTDINVSQTLTITGAGAIVTAITDSVSQAKAPEPASLALLGAGLLGLGWAKRKRNV